MMAVYIDNVGRGDMLNHLNLIPQALFWKIDTTCLSLSWLVPLICSAKGSISESQGLQLQSRMKGILIVEIPFQALSLAGTGREIKKPDAATSPLIPIPNMPL